MEAGDWSGLTWAGLLDVIFLVLEFYIVFAEVGDFLKIDFYWSIVVILYLMHCSYLNGKEVQMGGIYVYVWLIHFDVQ